MLDAWVAERIGCPGPLRRNALEEYTLRRLRETAARARARSPFYRERLPETPIRSFEDFRALPFTTPEDLKAQGQRMLCVGPEEVERIVTLFSSGSTGTPKRVYFTAADQETTIDYFHHGIGEFVAPGWRVLSLFPGESPGSLNDLLGRALLRLGCRMDVFGFPTPERYEALFAAILAGGYDFLAGPAEAMAEPARLSERTGAAAALRGQIRGVLLSASFVSDADRSDIGRIWDCRVNEHYGMTETGLGGGVGCTQPGLYHLWESGLYYELIDSQTLLPVPDGCDGEIVVTTLTDRGMPFIRYRTGDRSRILPGPCPCGSILRRMERVQARPVGKKFQREIPKGMER